MSGFKYELTEPLNLIYQAKKDNLITEEERKTIKEYIITKEPDLTTSLGKYNKTKDLKALMEAIKFLAKIPFTSSTTDIFLLKAKKRNYLNKKKKELKKKNKKQEEENVETDKNDNNGLPLINLVNCIFSRPKTFKVTKTCIL